MDSSAVNRKPRVKRPTNPKYTLLQPEVPCYLKLYEHHFDVLQDRNLLAVFSALAFVGNGTVISDTAAGIEREPWFQTSISHISNLTFGMSEKTVSGHIDTLRDRGFLFVHEDEAIGVKNSYLINYESMNLASIGKTTDASVKLPMDTRKTTDGPSVKLPTHTGKITDVYKEERILNETIEEKEKEISLSSQGQKIPSLLKSSGSRSLQESFPPIPVAPPDGQRESDYENTESRLHPDGISEQPEGGTEAITEEIMDASTDYENRIQPDVDVLDFVKNAYRQSRGSKVTKSEIAKNESRLRSSEESSGMEEFRESLWAYLEQSSDWLREHKWPLNGFLKNIQSGSSSGYGRSKAQTSHSASRRENGTSIAENRNERPQSLYRPNTETENLLLQYRTMWDTIVHVRPIDRVLETTIPKFEKSLQSKDFRECFDKVCQKCMDVLKVSPKQNWTFSWLFVECGKQMNWQAVLEGKFDWIAQSAEPKKKTGVASMMDELIRKAKAGEIK